MTQDNIYANLIEAVEERAQCRIAESINFKLNVGDTLRSTSCINGYSLYLTRLLHSNMLIMCYELDKKYHRFETYSLITAKKQRGNTIHRYLSN